MCVKEKEEEKSQTRYCSASVHTCQQVWTSVWTSSTLWKCDGGCVYVCICSLARPCSQCITESAGSILHILSPFLSLPFTLSLSNTDTHFCLSHTLKSISLNPSSFLSWLSSPLCHLHPSRDPYGSNSPTFFSSFLGDRARLTQAGSEPGVPSLLHHLWCNGGLKRQTELISAALSTVTRT